MINLIPNEEKKVMSKDFYLRLIAVSFMVLGFSLSVASVAILPSYFISSTEKKSINTKLESQKNESDTSLDQTTLAVASDLENKLNLIENDQKGKVAFSQEVINEIILKKTPGIKITDISYQKDPEAGETINVNGIASSRETLLLFSRALQDDTAFSKVDLPISNFVKGSNINFNLSLIPS